MIALYLKSLAATVRDLVASGKAVHVTHETAPELDLLAELPWNQAPLLVLNERITAPGEHEVTARPITSADLALGWLLASRAQPQEDYIEGPNDVMRIERILDDGAKRAAECAELAALSPIASPAENLIKDFVASLGTGEPPRALRRVYAHDGTREGARAAWDFIGNAPLSVEQAAPIIRSLGMTVRDFVAVVQPLTARYRRELEAM